MKKITKTFFASLALLFLVSTTAVAQSPTDFTGSLLWEVSGNGLNKPSYILGTHHLTSIEVVDSIANFKDVLEKSEQVVGELVMTDKQAMGMAIQQKMMITDGSSYKTTLSDAEYVEMDSLLIINFSAGIDQMGVIKPGMLSTLFSLSLYQKLYADRDLSNHIAIDEFVQQQAVANNKSVLGLETVEDQIYALFESSPFEVQAKSLLCTMQHPDYQIESVKKLENLYRNANLYGMLDLMNQSDDPCPINEKYSNALLKERNDKWMTKLPEIIGSKSSFIAVGALHLAGEDGILYQLSKLGYKVTPIIK